MPRRRRKRERTQIAHHWFMKGVIVFVEVIGQFDIFCIGQIFIVYNSKVHYNISNT